MDAEHLVCDVALPLDSLVSVVCVVVLRGLVQSVRVCFEVQASLMRFAVRDMVCCYVGVSLVAEHWMCFVGEPQANLIFAVRVAECYSLNSLNSLKEVLMLMVLAVWLPSVCWWAGVGSCSARPRASGRGVRALVTGPMPLLPLQPLLMTRRIMRRVSTVSIDTRT